MKKLLFLLFLVPSLSHADRLGSLKANSDVMLSTAGIKNQNTLQSGATFFVSSGTVAGVLTTSTATISGWNVSGIDNDFFLIQPRSSGMKLKIDRTNAEINIGNTASAGSVIFTSQNSLGIGNISYTGPTNGYSSNSHFGLQSGKELRLNDTIDSHYVAFKASAAVTQTNTYVVPASSGSADQGITTDGSNNLRFQTVIISTNGLQPGTTFFVSSGSVAGQLNIIDQNLHNTFVIQDTNTVSSLTLYISTPSSIFAPNTKTPAVFARVKESSFGQSLPVNISVSSNSTATGKYSTLSIKSEDSSGAEGYVAGTVNGFSAFTGTTYYFLVQGGQVRFQDSTLNNYVALKSSATLPATVTFTLPQADGTSGQALVTDGNKNWSFATVSGGGGGASSLEVFSNFDATRSSPTASISIGDALKLSVTGSTAVINVDFSSVPSRGDAILNQNTLQTGATFYVSSGSVQGKLTLYDQLVSTYSSSAGPPFVVRSTVQVMNLNATSISSRTIGTSGFFIPLMANENTWSNIQHYGGGGGGQYIQLDGIDTPQVYMISNGGSYNYGIANQFSTYGDDAFCISEFNSASDLACFQKNGITFGFMSTTFQGDVTVNGPLIGLTGVAAQGLLEANAGIRYLSSTTISLSVDQNNYLLPNQSFVRIRSSAPKVNLSGFVASSDGNTKYIVNVSTNLITFLNESALSTAANRIVTGTGGDFILSSSSTIHAIYDLTSQRWRLF